MLNLNDRAKIFNLLDAGFAAAEIAKRTGKSLGTIYKYQKSRAQESKSDDKTFSFSPKVLPFVDYLKDRLKGGITNGRKLFNEIRQQGYLGSYGLLQGQLKWLHPRENARYRRSVQVITGPGEQAQVDWASFGKIVIGGRIERLYIFVYVLSYSRALYVEFVVRQNQQTLQSCHMHAFQTLGIPKKIRYDNMKTVVLRREKLLDGSTRDHYNPAFLDFANYYGFAIELCPRYWPRSKGKIESGAKYVRYNFMDGNMPKKEFVSLEDLNLQVGEWIAQVAGERIHGTTGVKPRERWLEEKSHLKFPHTLPLYNASPFISRRSTKDALVQFKSNLYSVPSRYARRKLYLREINRHGLPFLEIYHEDLLIATHAISPEHGMWILDDSHVLERNVSARKAPKDKQTSRGKTAKRAVDVEIRELAYYNALVE